MITRESRIREVLENPIGRDIIGRLAQYGGLDARLIDNPMTGAVKLSALPKIAPKFVDDALIDTLVELFNQDDGVTMPAPNHERAWWKEAIVYQIYPRSFKDSDADGVGDIRGVIEKLDYLAALGVTAIWFSPIFDSPNDDNGYDVRDYKSIMSEFGRMEDVEELIAALHARGMRIILDMVLNHTSDEHVWFTLSRSDEDGPYGDYYIWRKGKDGGAPNNWRSFFSGEAWNYYPERDAYALHLFSKKQMDLNWANERVRSDIYDIMAFWREKGVDGYRLDVINYISKSTLADGNKTIGSVLGFSGIEHYFYGNRLHAFLREYREKGLKDAFAIGETPGTGPEMNKLLTAPARRELDTVFCFDHLDNIGKSRYTAYRYDLNHLKRCFLAYEGAYADVAWPSIFVENHDNPRMVSKVDPSGRYAKQIAKLLAVMTLTARGTVFVYQGQELGMQNVPFRSIDEMRDVEFVNKYAELKESGSAAPFESIICGARDHARTPMQWTNGANAGFTDGTPWIRVGEYENINAESEEADKDSVLHFYRAAIALRSAGKDALVYGAFSPVEVKRKNLFCYFRRGEKDAYYIEMNLSAKPIAPPRRPEGARLVLGSNSGTEAMLRPYEANVYYLADL